MGELEKIMKLGKLKQAIKLMSATGLLKHILPEVEALKGVKQRPDYHGEKDLFTHVLMVLENAPPGVENQMAALLHDIGKPATTKIIEEQITSKGHEEVGSEIAEAIMKRLKFDNDATGRVKKIVRNHMRPHSLSGAGPKALRKFIRDVGDELVESVLNLARADELGKIPASNDIPDLKKRIEEIKTRVNITKKPVLNGDEIMELLKIPTGTEVGRAKKFLIDLEDDYAEKDKTLSKEEAREELLKEFHKKVALSDVLRSIIIN